MLSLTRKTDYALVALAYLGDRRARGAGPISAAHIAEQFGLPRALLMNVLKELAHANLLRSTRGAHGGYTLAADADRITVLEVVTAIEGPTRLTECCDGLPIVGQGCRLSDTCPIRDPVRRLHDRIQRLLDEMTVADLLNGKVNTPTDTIGRDGDDGRPDSDGEED